MKTATIKLPQLHRKQKEVQKTTKRFNVLCCGRRWGKTIKGEDIAVHDLLKGGFVAWYSPTYKDMLEVWRDFNNILHPLITKSNASEKRIELITGGVIDFWTCENRDAGRGRKYHMVIVDEAAKVPYLLDMWQQTIRPTLADYSGGAWFLSTPRGFNDFYKMYNLSKTHDEWAGWQFSTFDNPHMDTAEIKAMQKELPQNVFNQEILANFVDSAGGVFRNIRECAGDYWQEKPQKNHGYIFGVDVALKNDFTVITVVDVDTQQVCYIDRFNQVGYKVQVNRIKSLYELFKPICVYVESNGMGHGVIERLQDDNIPVHGFTTTNATKKAIIEKLASAFEHGEIGIPEDETLINELMAFEANITKSGNITYSAPSGLHDDCVMSLAIAWNESSKVGNLLLW